MSAFPCNIDSVLSRQVATVIVLLFLGGCSSLPEDLGRSEVDALVSGRGQQPEKVSDGDRQALVASITAEPLTVQSVKRLALINNPRLWAEYARLGFAAADVYAAAHIRNPIFSAAILDSNQSGELNQNTFGLVASFTDLLTLPARKRLANAEFTAVKQAIAAKVLDTAAEAEGAYYRYVAARQIAALRTKIAKTGKLSSELAKRYHAAGNLTPRDLELEKAATSELRLASLAAQAEARAMRTELANVLGLVVDGKWEAPARLSVPLTEEDDLANLQQLARESRLDLIAARTRTQIIADRMGVSEWTRWLGELNVGVERERDTDGAKLTGPTLEWELPIFTHNRDVLLRQEAELQTAIADVVQLITQVDNGVSLAHGRVENASERVDEYLSHLLPARIAAVARAQEEENFMLIGIFELLQTKQQEYNAYQGYLKAVGDYWLARAELFRVVGHELPSSAAIGAEHIDVDKYLHPKEGGRSGHGDMEHRSDKAALEHSAHDATEPNDTEHIAPPSLPSRHNQHDGDSSSHDINGGSP